MIEARAFVKSLDDAREILNKEKADFKGEYKIIDKIYKSKNKPLIEEFLRLRTIPKNIWGEKSVIVAIKNTELKEYGKNSVIPLKKQFDNKEEALKYINESGVLDNFEFSFSFERIGWQYDLGIDQVDLEDVEGHASIEIKSNTEDGIKKLMDMFKIEKVITGPSVVVVKELLNK